MDSFAMRGGARRVGSVALLVAAAWITSTPAIAQAALPDCTIAANNCFYAFGDTGFTASTSEELVFNAPSVVTNQTTSFRTELIGKITGGAPLYDRTFALPFSDPAVQAGVGQARLAITTAGGPGVVILGPTLTSRTVTTTSSSVTTYSLDHTVISNTVTTFDNGTIPGTDFVINQTNGEVSYNGAVIGAFSAPCEATGGLSPICFYVVENVVNGVVRGPTPSLYIGTRSTCGVSVASLPSTARPTCSSGGTPVLLAGGQVVFNVDTGTTDYIDQATTTTTDTLTSEVYTLTGTVKPIGTVHAVAAVAGFEQAEGFIARLFAMSDDAQGLWIDGWGQASTTPGRGDTPGDSRSGGGINGGFQYRLTDALRIGASVDWGRTSLGLHDAGESGGFDLTTAAFNAAFESGPLFAHAAIGLGSGHLSTTVSPIGLGETATSRDGVNVYFGGAEAGWRFTMDDVVLTPHAGLTYTGVHMGGFVETGSALALQAPSADFRRGQFYAGLDASIPLSPSFEVGGFTRVATRFGDLAPRLPVSFTAGGPLLVIEAPGDDGTGADLGLHAGYALADGIQAFAAYEAFTGGRSVNQSANVGITIATF
ncbi:MAG: autotransporter outer membrane beta-barrel domain-containing protein [Rhizomicrobium sp.]